jgi:hypothetical protein
MLFKLGVGTTQNFTSSYYFLVIHSLITRTELHHSKESLHCSKESFDCSWVISYAQDWHSTAQGCATIMDELLRLQGESSQFQGEPPVDWAPWLVIAITWRCATQLQTDPLLLQIKSPLLQDCPLCHHGSKGASIIPGWYSIAPDFTFLLGLASTSPDFSLRINYYDSRASLQGSSTGPHNSSESLYCSELTPYSKKLAFMGLGLASRTRMVLHSSMMSLQGSIQNIYCSRVTLHGSSISFYDSRVSFHYSRVSLHGSRVSFTAPGWAFTVPGWTSTNPYWT